MRQLTKTEIENAPDWAKFYCNNDDYHRGINYLNRKPVGAFKGLAWHECCFDCRPMPTCASSQTTTTGKS